MLYIDTVDIEKLITVLAIVVVLICVFLFLFLKIDKAVHKKKPLIKNRGRVLEKNIENSKIERYVVEFDSGERVHLRNHKADKLCISEGDVGEIVYRGELIENFVLDKDR